MKRFPFALGCSASLALAGLVGCSSSDSSAGSDAGELPDAAPDNRADGGPEPDASEDGALTDAGDEADGAFGDVAEEVEAGGSSEDCTRLAALDAELATMTEDGVRAAAVAQFLGQIAGSAGMPVRCGGTVTFVFGAPQGFGVASVAGDFNGWDAAAAPMAAVGGVYWRASLPVDPGLNRYLYKFTNGQQWVADPEARRFGYDQNGEYSLVSGGMAKGHLERHRGIAGAGLEPRDVTMYLPPGYEATQGSYPVLYAQDGQNLFDPTAFWGGWHLDEAIEGLLQQNAIQPMVVAGISNTAARMDEYTHVPDEVTGQTVGGQAEAYYSLLVTEVMPLVGKHYRVKTGPANTWTMGSSLGGVISLYFGMKHPEVFGRVAGMSTTAGWGSIALHNQTLIELLPTLGKPSAVFYLDSGGDDGGGSGCVDTDGDGIRDDTSNAGDNYCESLQLREVFLAQGYVSGSDLEYWWEAGAEHNEAAWAARVYRPLEILAAP